MSDKSKIDEEVAMVRKCCEQLGEHFDSVQIFCTRHDSGELDGTASIQLGVGNFFTRYGQVKEWAVKQDERTRMKARSEDGEKL